MRRRRHYGTTGNRAFVSVVAELNREGELFERDPALGPATAERSSRLLMGDIARVADDEIDFVIEVVGSAPIERLDIHDGLDLIETVRPYTDQDLGHRVRLVYTGAEYRGRARTTTWDGTLLVEGNRILRTGVINNWNLDRGIQQADSSQVSWKAVTTGNYGGIDLWMDKTAGRLAFQTKPVSGEVMISELGVEPQRFDAGGLDRAVEVQRLPEVMNTRAMKLRRRIKLRSSGDTRLYVRVQQEDGHRVWTSPIYLFR
jgi:hypothetical protein